MGYCKVNKLLSFFAIAHFSTAYEDGHKVFKSRLPHLNKYPLWDFQERSPKDSALLPLSRSPSPDPSHPIDAPVQRAINPLAKKFEFFPCLVGQIFVDYAKFWK
jgi:hypothetical protein